MTDFYVDLYEGNSVTSADALRAAGALGVMHRAYYGLHSDVALPVVWPKLADAGMRRWTYYYLRWSQSRHEQAARHAEAARKYPGDFAPVIDIEQDGLFLPGCQVDFLYDYFDTWDAEGGPPLAIYSSPYYWSQIAMGAPTGGQPPHFTNRYELIEAQWFTVPSDVNTLAKYIAWRAGSQIVRPWSLPAGFAPGQLIMWQSAGDKPTKIYAPGVAGPVDVLEEIHVAA